jgi:hypothetical protein
MLQSEKDSNLAEWISEYPANAIFIRANEPTFSLFPPAHKTSEMGEGQWERVVNQIIEQSRE